MGDRGDGGATVTVHLLGVPVGLHARASAHGDALRREMELIRRSDPDGDSTPQRLHEVIERITARFGGFGDALSQEVADAQRHGRDRCDVELVVPRAVADACTELGALLDEVDDYCRRGGDLLTLASPPEIVAYRAWLLAEISGQIAGAPPTPWPGLVPLATTPHDGLVIVDGTPPMIEVRGDLDLATAPELRSAVAELRHGEVTELVLDLRRASIVDSVGLSVIVATHARMADDGGVLRVLVNPELRRVLDLTGLLDVLHVDE